MYTFVSESILPSLPILLASQSVRSPGGHGNPKLCITASSRGATVFELALRRSRRSWLDDMVPLNKVRNDVHMSPARSRAVEVNGLHPSKCRGYRGQLGLLVRWHGLRRSSYLPKMSISSTITSSPDTCKGKRPLWISLFCTRYSIIQTVYSVHLLTRRTSIRGVTNHEHLRSSDLPL